MPKTPLPQLELERFLPYRLSVLSNRISAAIAADYEQRLGLSVTEWRVIAVLARFPGLSATQVAEKTGMDKVAVSRACERLLAAARLTRQTARADKRRAVLKLTQAGLAVYRDVAPRALAFERQLLAVLEEGERAALAVILDKLAAADLRQARRAMTELAPARRRRAAAGTLVPTEASPVLAKRSD